MADSYNSLMVIQDCQLVLWAGLYQCDVTLTTESKQHANDTPLVKWGLKKKERVDFFIAWLPAYIYVQMDFA